MPPLEPRSLSRDEIGRLPRLALDLLRRSWLKSLGSVTALAVLALWCQRFASTPLALLFTFIAGGAIMAAGFWTARAADRGEALLSRTTVRPLLRGCLLGLALGVIYFAWGLPTTASASGPSELHEMHHAFTMGEGTSGRIATLPQLMHPAPAVDIDGEPSTFASGIAFALERGRWVSIAASLGMLLIVIADICGNGLAAGLVFVPLCVLGLSVPQAMMTAGRTAAKNRVFLRQLFAHSPEVVLGLKLIVVLIVLAPDILAFVSPLVTLFAMYLGALSYVTYRAVFEGRNDNSPMRRRARAAQWRLTPAMSSSAGG